MKILIVGGKSSLGVALLPVLLGIGEVVTAGRKDCDIILDISESIDNIKIPANLDVIVHAAANFGGVTDNEIFDAENVNALGTLKLCQLAVQANVKHFVLISSLSVCLDEKSDYYSIYALSKKHAEELARLYCSYHSLPLAILRPSQIYGNEDIFRRHQPFIYSVIDKAKLGEVVTIYGSHDAQRNYIYIDDLTMIIAKVVTHKIVGTYSCMHPENVTLSGVARAAISAFNSKGGYQFAKEKKDIPDNIFDNDDMLYRQINFYPEISIEDGMKKIAYYRSTLL